MADYHSIIARAVSHLPHNDDEARYAIYEQARTALHRRLGNDPQISDAELVNEHHKLEVAIHEGGRGLVTEGYAPVCKRRNGSFPSKLNLEDKGIRTLGRRQAGRVLTHGDASSLPRALVRRTPTKLLRRARC